MIRKCLLRLDNVSYKYRRKYIFKNVSYEFLKGNIYVIEGQYGRLFLDLLSGFKRVREGYIYYEGNVLKKNIFKRKISSILKNYYLKPNLTVRENLNLKKYSYEIREILQKVKLNASYLDKRIDELDKLECMKVVLAKSLKDNPKIIIIDELIINLKSKEIINILKYLAYRDDKCIFIIRDKLKSEGLKISEFTF